jgi:hypothetical protein
MPIGARFVGGDGAVVTNLTVSGAIDIAVSIIDTQNAVLDGINASLKPIQSRRDGPKLGRNAPCQCGSGLKFKKCHGKITMGTGIKSNNSTFTVGKARIIADVAVDLQNQSNGHIEDLVHLDPRTSVALAEVLLKFELTPPKEFLDEALVQLRAARSVEPLEKSRLKAWCFEQGLTVAFFVEFAASLLSIALQR